MFCFLFSFAFSDINCLTSVCLCVPGEHVHGFKHPLIQLLISHDIFKGWKWASEGLPSKLIDTPRPWRGKYHIACTLKHRSVHWASLSVEGSLNLSFQSGHDDNIPWPLLMRILSQTNSPSGTKWLCSIKVQTQYQVPGIGTPKWNAALRLILAALDFDQSNCRPVYFMTFYVKDINILIAYLWDFFYRPTDVSDGFNNVLWPDQGDPASA